MTLVLVVGLVGGGAFAYFSDTETSEDNTFTAGTLDLKFDNDPDGSVFNWVDDPDLINVNDVMDECVNNLKPGDSDIIIIGIKNAGTVDGWADIHILNVVDYDNGGTEPEIAVPDTNTGDPGAGEGELSMYVDVVLSYGDKSVIGSTWDAWVEVASGTLAAIACTDYYWTAPIEAGVDDYWVIEFSIASDVGNIIQSDSVEFDVEFSLDQEEP